MRTVTLFGLVLIANAIDYLIKNGYLRIISYGIMTQDHIVTYTGK